MYQNREDSEKDIDKTSPEEDSDPVTIKSKEKGIKYFFYNRKIKKLKNLYLHIKKDWENFEKEENILKDVSDKNSLMLNESGIAFISVFTMSLIVSNKIHFKDSDIPEIIKGTLSSNAEAYFLKVYKSAIKHLTQEYYRERNSNTFFYFLGMILFPFRDDEKMFEIVKNYCDSKTNSSIFLEYIFLKIKTNNEEIMNFCCGQSFTGNVLGFLSFLSMLCIFGGSKYTSEIAIPSIGIVILFLLWLFMIKIPSFDSEKNIKIYSITEKAGKFFFIASFVLILLFALFQKQNFYQALETIFFLITFFAVIIISSCFLSICLGDWNLKEMFFTLLKKTKKVIFGIKKFLLFFMILVTDLVMLFAGLINYFENGYYTFLRIMTFGVAGFLAYKNRNSLMRFILGVTAILYNPVFVIHLERNTWEPINIITIPLLIIGTAIFVYSELKKPVDVK